MLFGSFVSSRVRVGVRVPSNKGGSGLNCIPCNLVCVGFLCVALGLSSVHQYVILEWTRHHHYVYVKCRKNSMYYCSFLSLLVCPPVFRSGLIISIFGTLTFACLIWVHHRFFFLDP